MNMGTRIRSLLALILLLMATPSLASTVSYIMDGSNALPDHVDYLSVTISDDTEGKLDFRVETLSALSDIAGENYGIQSFGFNYRDFLFPMGDEGHGMDSGYPGDFILPEGWRVQYDRGMSEAGIFDVRISGTGSRRQDPLHFSVIGLSLDDILPGFAAHVAGFDLSQGECNDDIPCGDHITSAFFFGERETSVVPIPGAVLLFGSGLVGLIGIARRRS